MEKNRCNNEQKKIRYINVYTITIIIINMNTPIPPLSSPTGGLDGPDSMCIVVVLCKILPPPRRRRHEKKNLRLYSLLDNPLLYCVYDYHLLTVGQL